jgi:hypothetical protein
VFNYTRCGLVRAAVLILGHLGCLRVPELATTSTTPTVKKAFSRERHRMGIATRDLYYAHVLQALYEERNRLIWIALDILWHMLCVAVPQLSAGTGSPAVQLTMDGHCRGVSIATCNLADFHALKRLYQTGRWFIGVAILILGQVLKQREAKLAHFTAAP